MFARETSIDAYREIRDNGLLKGLQFEVYSLLYMYGSSTASELEEKARKASVLESVIKLIHQRMSELNRMGVVREREKRVCKVTGHMAIVWEVTHSLPEKLGKQISAKARIGAEAIRWVAAQATQEHNSRRILSLAAEWEKNN